MDAGATLDECIVTDGVRVAAGASIGRVVLIAGDDGGELAASEFAV